MLRACGRRSGDGRLWKTVDGGQRWVKLGFDGDFDGDGPSAMCGEVLAFDLRTPPTLYVGCESKGFSKSTDGGTTWGRMGLTGERITAVTVWPWERNWPDIAKGMTHLCVSTCPDRWMSFLGRGDPTISTSATASRSYVSPDNVQSLSVLDERNDTGFYNVAFDMSVKNPREISYGTAHGYQHNSGGHMSLFSELQHLEWLRPITALGTTALGERREGIFLTQALDPAAPGRLSRSERWGMEWAWQPTINKGAVSKVGLIAVSGNQIQGDKWWFVYTDGLYHSADRGTTLTKVLDEKGMPVN